MGGTPRLKQKHLDGGQHHRHGVYLVLVTVEQLLSVMMPNVRTLVKWSMTMPKRKGGDGCGKKTSFHKSSPSYQKQKCAKILSKYIFNIKKKKKKKNVPKTPPKIFLKKKKKKKKKKKS